MFQKILVANRGDVAQRVIRSLRKMNIKSVAIYSDADTDAPYLAEADEVYGIGGKKAQDSYLNQDKILEILKKCGADAVHPGYGFLSENTVFAAAVERAGKCFIGPSAKFMDAMSHKSHARALMKENGMPVSAGSGVLNDDPKYIRQIAANIGYPVLVKPVGGGGGIGMLQANTEDEVVELVTRAKALAKRTFSNADVYLEKYIINPRHIEIQIIGDKFGNVQPLFERDCSIQRRHQKVIEEAPAPLLDRSKIDALGQTVAKVLSNIGYNSVGTVEMLRDKKGNYSFLEMNTRLQVEHAVTEAITGLDLVAAQIKVAAGFKLSDILPPVITQTGHAIELRIYAEDPIRFFPSPGLLKEFMLPQAEGIRIETGYQKGMKVTPYYDPLVAKIIAHSDTRDACINLLIQELEACHIEGIKTNIPFLLSALRSDMYRKSLIHTGFIDSYQHISK